MYKWPPYHVWLGYSHKYFKGNQVDKHKLKFNQKLYGVISNLCAHSHPSTRFSETTLHNLIYRTTQPLEFLIERQLISHCLIHHVYMAYPRETNIVLWFGWFTSGKFSGSFIMYISMKRCFLFRRINCWILHWRGRPVTWLGRIRCMLC